MKDYTEYIVEQTQKLLSIDSPTGYTKNVAAYLMKVYTELGYDPELTTKGGVFVKIADGVSEDREKCDPAAGPILMEAHVDTLGAMVSEITSAGHLNLTPLGGMNPNNAEAENCRIVTRSGNVYTGTFQLRNASIHVNGEYNNTKKMCIRDRWISRISSWYSGKTTAPSFTPDRIPLPPRRGLGISRRSWIRSCS